MARGLLVSYGGYPYALSSLFPDNGLASLAAVLRTEGHECQVLDFNTAELAGRIIRPAARDELRRLLPRLSGDGAADCLEPLLAINGDLEERSIAAADDVATALVQRCRTESVDFVGFKLWSGDGFEASVRMAERIRAACPAVKLFAGGPAVHYSGDVVLDEAPVFDAVVDGDGEPAIVELARYAEGRRKLAGIPNVLGAEGSDGAERVFADLSSLPAPDYSREAYPSLHEGSRIKIICLDESRGCPIRCAFCINWRIEGDTWRTRSADDVVAEMRTVQQQLHTRGFRLAGTYSKPELVRGVCQGIIKAGLHVEFGLFLNAGAVTAELVALLKQAGCFGVFFGIESGSEEILERAMNKPANAARVERALQRCGDAGLFTVGSFIFPAPGETPATEKRTRRLIRRVFAGRPNTAVLVTFPGLIPRTTWWRERSRYGFELTVSEREYRSLVLRYKMRHLIPSALWPPMPYRLDGHPLSALAARTSALQRWIEERGVCTNLPDHDAQIGATLGRPPSRFKEDARRLFFTGDAEGMQELVDQANEGLAY